MKFLENTWMLLQLCPNFNFEEKVDIKGEGIVMKLPAGGKSA